MIPGSQTAPDKENGIMELRVQKLLKEFGELYLEFQE
jgi:hypothetical protein